MEYITHSPEETEALGAEYAKASRQAMLLRSPATSVPARPHSRAACCTDSATRAASPARPLPLQTNTKRRRSRSRTSTCTAFSTAKRCSRSAFDEYLDGSRIVLIEWSENAADVLPEAYKTVHIAYGDADNDRRITIGEVTV